MVVPAPVRRRALGQLRQRRVIRQADRPALGHDAHQPPPEFAPDTRFHPIFLYESLWNLLAFGVLLWLWLRYRDRMKTGDFLLLYLVLYGIVRFLLEYLRVDVTLVNGVNVSQVTTAVTGIVALILLIARHRDLLRDRARNAQRDAAETARRS